MKKLLSFSLIILVISVLIIACKDKKKANNNAPYLQVLRIDCESMVDSCNNRPGLRFTGESLGSWIEPVGKPGYYERIPYHHIICCENIPAFIDTLKAADSLRKKWIREKPDSMNKIFALPGNVKVRVTYEKASSIGEYSVMWFGFVPVFYITTKEFDQLIKDIEERFETCCLN